MEFVVIGFVQSNEWEKLLMNNETHSKVLPLGKQRFVLFKSDLY